MFSSGEDRSNNKKRSREGKNRGRRGEKRKREGVIEQESTGKEGEEERRDERNLENRKGGKWR